MKREKSWRREDGFLLRSGKQEDAEAYYSQNYCPLDGEAARLTGCKTAFTREEVTQFFLHAVESGDRHLFLLLSPEGRIVGETALTDIDTQLRSANFRMAIFQPGLRGKGLGTWAARATRDFAFAELKLHRLELDVFSFNPRAERCYRKAGFRRRASGGTLWWTAPPAPMGTTSSWPCWRRSGRLSNRTKHKAQKTERFPGALFCFLGAGRNSLLTFQKM